MAFLAEKYNEPFTCPVCKKKVKSGMKLLPPYNCAAENMCDNCFGLSYKNTQLNRRAAKIYDTLNYATQRRNADVFDEDETDILKTPDMGYEYVYPRITNRDVIHEYFSWAFIVVFLKIVSNLIFYAASSSTDTLGFYIFLNVVLVFVSVVLLLKKVKNHIDFKHRGASKKRRRQLIVASLVYAIIIVTLVYGMINKVAV